MALINLFAFLVQGIWGSVAVATVFMVLLIWGYGVWARMGPMLTGVVSLLYAMIILMAYYGGIVGGLMFGMALVYFIVSLLPWISTMWER